LYHQDLLLTIQQKIPEDQNPFISVKKPALCSWAFFVHHTGYTNIYCFLYTISFLIYDLFKHSCW